MNKYRKPEGLVDGSRMMAVIPVDHMIPVDNRFEFVVHQGRWVLAPWYHCKEDLSLQLDPEGWLWVTKAGIRTGKRSKCKIFLTCCHEKRLCW